MENIRIEIDPIVEKDVLASADPMANSTPPRIVFIVPYRDREQQQQFFARQMQYVLSDFPPDSYQIYYAHQKDHRDFNRGAMRNIGFLAIKAKYPLHYKNITFVFNDVDTMPYTKNFINYETTHGTVKHPYGFNYTLGGIVSIKGGDFEKTNGYPNYWAWGYEDNLFQSRVLHNGLRIDREVFYPVGSKDMIQLQDGATRVVNPNVFKRYIQNEPDGLDMITDIEYTLCAETGFIDITHFNVPSPNLPGLNKTHDLSQGKNPFNRRGATMGINWQRPKPAK